MQRNQGGKKERGTRKKRRAARTGKKESFVNRKGRILHNMRKEKRRENKGPTVKCYQQRKYAVIGISRDVYVS